MAIIDWPSADAFKPTLPYSFGVSTPKSSTRGFYTGNVESVGHLSDRYLTSITLPPCSGQEAAGRSAFLMSLLSTGDIVRFTPPHHRNNFGTLRGSPTVQSSILAGARSVVLANARAGNNLLRSADTIAAVLATGWTLANATITANAVADPQGGMTGWLLNRTAAGNHFAYTTLTLASTALRTVSAIVWLRAGTLTGNVVLRIRDGAGVSDVATVSVTPTSTWLPYRISGTFGAGSAPNVQLYIDPANDAGSAGDNLQVWFAETRALTGVDTLCTTMADWGAAPTGMQGASDLVTRTGAGNAYTTWYYPTSAHAGQTFTFSVWLKTGTFTSAISLYMRDGAGTQVAAATVTPSGAWQPFSITGTFGASPAADIYVFVDQTDLGSVGETFERYGVQLEPGGGASTFYPWPTASAGDFISAGGNLLQVAYPGASGDVTGAITVPLTLPAPKPLAVGAPIITNGPTGLWQIDTTDGISFDFSAPVVQQGVTIPFRQVIA